MKMSGRFNGRKNAPDIRWIGLEVSWASLGTLEKRKIPAAVGNRTATPVSSPVTTLTYPSAGFSTTTSDLSCRFTFQERSTFMYHLWADGAIVLFGAAGSRDSLTPPLQPVSCTVTIQLFICLTRSPYLLPKSLLHTVRSNVSSFNSRYPLVSSGHAVAQLVEALHYKPEGRGFDSRCCQWNDIILLASLWPWGLTQPLTALTTLPPSCADCLEIWEPQPPGTLRACPGL